MENGIQELARLLPHVVREKFRYYQTYIHERLIDVALEEGVINRIGEIQSEVDTIFLLRLLYAYFVIGFRNYEQMLGFFENNRVSGFQIGSTVYTRQSPVTIEWQQVAHELEKLTSESGTALYVRPTLSVDEVLRRIVQSLSGISPRKE